MRTPAKIAVATISAVVAIAAISIIATLGFHTQTRSGQEPPTDVSSLEVSDVPAQSPFETELTYPTAWLAKEANDSGIPAGEPVSLMYAPGMDIRPHRAGQPVDGALLPSDPDKAVVEYDGTSYDVDPGALLVNLPDVLSNAVYDIRYAYDTPSRSGGNEIPGLTGSVLPNYAPSERFDAYIGQDARPVPIALKTAQKLITASARLGEGGYHLLIWDGYRPYSASRFISEKFSQAYESNPDIRTAVGDQWGLSWYAADGASGHNYGTDVDVSLVRSDGSPVSMPSDFDAFDESAHLTDVPMNSSSISPDKYRQSVKDNEPLMLLHLAMTEAGFSELASEWWHFADKSVENDMRMLIGNSGLDFEAKVG